MMVGTGRVTMKEQRQLAGANVWVMCVIWGESNGVERVQRCEAGAKGPDCIGESRKVAISSTRVIPSELSVASQRPLLASFLVR